MALPINTVDKQNDSVNEWVDLVNEAITELNDASRRAAVTSSDTSVGYLDDKIVAGDGVTLTVIDPGASETLEISLTPAEAWINFSGSLGTYIASQDLKYRKDGYGRVTLRGTFSFNSSVGVNAGSVLTLPSGYRPAFTMKFPSISTNGGTTYFGSITINTSGILSYYMETSAGNLNNYLVYLDGISFYID